MGSWLIAATKACKKLGVTAYIIFIGIPFILSITLYQSSRRFKQRFLSNSHHFSIVPLLSCSELPTPSTMPASWLLSTASLRAQVVALSTKYDIEDHSRRVAEPVVDLVSSNQGRRWYLDSVV